MLFTLPQNTKRTKPDPALIFSSNLFQLLQMALIHGVDICINYLPLAVIQLDPLPVTADNDPVILNTSANKSRFIQNLVDALELRGVLPHSIASDTDDMDIRISLLSRLLAHSTRFRRQFGFQLLLACLDGRPECRHLRVDRLSAFHPHVCSHKITDTFKNAAGQIKGIAGLCEVTDTLEPEGDWVAEIDIDDPECTDTTEVENMNENLLEKGDLEASVALEDLGLLIKIFLA
ncbi:unnamed protein product [Protopolystoma xenopodis]|uniref:Uncharacterized protein n=1 Tax=Protopolystoma xenopodis TaxID=117903 RepID=A0A448WXI7_9PLAT|nr:unnamed protein product [Protopolystoma xenopodis]